MPPQPTPREACPGCGSTDIRDSVHASIRHCERCGGRLTFQPVTYDVLLRAVRLDQMQDGCAEPQYFDFLYFDLDEQQRVVTRRTHGWFDPTTKKVVQFG